MAVAADEAGEFQRIVLTNSRAFFAVAYGILRNSHAAEDALQDAVIKAWQSYGTLREKHKAVAWLARIVRNTALDHVRKTGIRGEVPLEELPVNLIPAAALPASDDRAPLESALATLPHDQALIVHLRFADGLDISEIARRLGITSNAARVRLHRAVTHLKKRTASAEGARS
ncbi:MAG: RNA polymerase sigma-70 factor ECF [Planctomycetota bacterium]|nr:MAG: RNA polymerase sigma-70 factor ECF [Planctomycetota bacterium]